LRRESGGGKDISEVRGGVLWGRLILLTFRNCSSLVIDSLCDQAEEEDITVAGFYCDFLSQQEQTTTNVLGAILKQLIGGGDIPEYLHKAFKVGKKRVGGGGLRLPDLVKMLGITIASVPQVFICIDALDECSQKCLHELLNSLRDIIQESPSTKVFLAGRPHVGEDVRRCFSKAVVIPISPNPDDIQNYVEMRLDRDAEPEAMTDDLRADIVRGILEKVSDMYVQPFPISTPSMMHTYQRLCVDSSSFR